VTIVTDSGSNLRPQPSVGVGVGGLVWFMTLPRDTSGDDVSGVALDAQTKSETETDRTRNGNGRQVKGGDHAVLLDQYVFTLFYC
jgi:hypothetical protein